MYTYGTNKEKEIEKMSMINFNIRIDEELKKNAETLTAIQEIEDMKAEKLPKSSQSVENLFEELEINIDN